ncbi:carbohydrate ABC transporter substrate-binding protein [Rhodospirillaceae bacterium KN72]|uniref:Carbohydrate ABC transporter substrate-binding protein n=1 Tax=Pacificispira spongiicola TaxID=2729598 RepID=A0A7Y0E1V1_9PROT|nr:ABC transporter substrate-binding protein [Pacificispira spongiicola]NMM45703.1 carbohydrate ABC transporter substrate-binding protein [Pacificispira spongiicola]
MFYAPKNALHRKVSRRKFLELGGGAAGALGVGSMAVGLGTTITRRPVYAASSEEAKWRQYEGTKLVFMSENTPPSFAIRDNIKAFYDKTGIEVEIITDGLPVVQQKIGIDLRSGNSDFALNYVQDKPIGAPFADFFADLTPLIGDDTLPQDPEGVDRDAWFPNFRDACGLYYDSDRLIALPYDSAVACTFYRQDLFEKYSKLFEQEYGYRMEYTADTTWQNVLDFATFFKALKESGEDVPYGYAQHNGSFAWTTQLDIQRLQFANGRWTDFDVDDKLGSREPGPTNWGDEQSILIMEKQKALGDVSHPDNLANGTLELNTVYQSGQIAMQVQYHEFAASVENPETSVAAGGRTGYGPCPKGVPEWIVNGGPAVNGTNCGIGGIGINGNASDDVKRAAYIFSIWATSRDTQFNVLKGVGGTPTRKSVMDIPEVQKARQRPTDMPNALTFDAVYDYGIKDPHFVLGPKFPEANEYHNIVAAEMQSCLAGRTTAEETCNRIKEQIDNLNGV